MDLSIQQLVLAVIGFLITVAVQGFAYAGIARLLGGRTPQYAGRLTINPAAHLDVLGIFSGVLFYLGWSRPIPMEPAQIRFGIGGIILCVIGSLAAVIVLAFVALFLRYPVETIFPDTVVYGALAVINATSTMAVWFAVFNIIPLPPLAAGQILLALWPRLRAWVRRHEWQTSLVAIVIAGIIARLPLARPLYEVLLRAVVPLSAAIAGIATQLTHMF